MPRFHSPFTETEYNLTPEEFARIDPLQVADRMREALGWNAAVDKALDRYSSSISEPEREFWGQVHRYLCRGQAQ